MDDKIQELPTNKQIIEPGSDLAVQIDLIFIRLAGQGVITFDQRDAIMSALLGLPAPDEAKDREWENAQVSPKGPASD